METTPGKRVQIFREYKGYKTASAFAEVAGLKVATLSSIETDRTSPSFDSLALLMGAFPDLNIDWLLTGAGPMLRDGKALAPVSAVAEPAATYTAGPALVEESEYIKELKASRDKAWEVADLFRDMVVKLENERRHTIGLPEQDDLSSPQRAVPGKASTDSFAAESDTTQPEHVWVGRQHRDADGNVKFSTDHVVLLNSGEMRNLAVAEVASPSRAISGVSEEKAA